MERPGLERVRDLSAEGHIQVVLAYAPDRSPQPEVRISDSADRETPARHGVETLFVKAPQGDSAEDQLLVQFQGMIAEYERAQIPERSRRGKRHWAQSGEISVLSGAPYGYRYIRKTDETPAAYTVYEAEAGVVQRASMRCIQCKDSVLARSRAGSTLKVSQLGKSKRLLGTLDYLGSTAQPQPSRRRLLRQDARLLRGPA